MDLTQLIQTVAALVQWKNDVTSNSKTNEELPAMDPVITDALIRLSKAGISKTITPQQIIDIAQELRFLDLIDVEDEDYYGKHGFAPVVVSQGGPPYGRLRLTRIPTFEDIYVQNGIIKGGVSHVQGLTYNVWVSMFVVNRVLYYYPISQLVTLNDGDSTNPRIDVIAVQVNTVDPANCSIVILEGDPAPSPIKEVVDLETQAEITFKLVNAGDVADPDVVTDLVYDENAGSPTEWTNTFLLDGGDLEADADPFNGSKYAIILDNATAIDPRVVWDKSSEREFNDEHKLIFALRTNGVWDGFQSLQIKLINSTSGQFSIVNLTKSTIENYGFFDELTTWQIVAIPLSDFISGNPTKPDYDRIEFKFNIFVYARLDWIGFQENTPIVIPPPPVNETKPTNQTAYLPTSIPMDNHEGYVAFETNPNTSINTFTTSNHKLLGQAFLHISTTGRTEFPTITGATLLNGDDFKVNELFIGHLLYTGAEVVVKWILKSQSNPNYVKSDPNGEPTGSDQILNIVSLTQAEYDAGTKLPETLYIITDA